MINNIYAPFPLPLHITFCVLATLLYAAQFYRKKHKHYFYLIIAIDLTLLTHFYTQTIFIRSLAVTEAILLVMIFSSMYIVSKRNKKLSKKDNTPLPPANQSIVGDAFSDNT